MALVSVWIPLLVGLVATALTILVHGTAFLANLHLVRRERRLGRAGVGFWIDMRIVGGSVMLAFGAHLVAIGLWALLFVGCGEFQAFGLAFYHSAMNYTTLGFGDIVMSPAWKLLEPLEATDGLLMFGVTTAMIFTVIQRLLWIRFPDLRS